jgi:hypothetical protein
MDFLKNFHEIFIIKFNIWILKLSVEMIWVNLKVVMHYYTLYIRVDWFWNVKHFFWSRQRQSKVFLLCCVLFVNQPKYFINVLLDLELFGSFFTSMLKFTNFNVFGLDLMYNFMLKSKKYTLWGLKCNWESWEPKNGIC